MFKKLLHFFGFGKGGEIETQKFEPLRRSTDHVDFPSSDITEAYATGKLPRRTAYVGGKQMPPAPMPTQFPPKAPPPYPVRHPQPAMQSDDIATQPFYNTPLSIVHDSPPCEAFAGKGGEFSGAGASGSWDSPSSSSSDTSSSSSDSGSSSSGSD